MTDLIFPDIFSPLSLKSGMGTKGNLGGSTESDIEPTPPPPADPRTFLFPFTENGLEAISGVPVNHQHASPQTEILDGELVTYAANEPVISDAGITGRGQDTNYHGYSADVTQIGTGGANFFSNKWTESAGVFSSFDSVTGIGNLTPNTANGPHKISMARIAGATLTNPQGRFHVMMEVRPVGWDIPDTSYTGLRKIGLTANLNDVMVIDIKNGTIDSLQLNGYIQVLSDGWIFIYHELDIIGSTGANNANLALLDDNGSFNWVGDSNKQLEIRSAVYSKQPNNANQYSPIINDTNAQLTRLASTQIYGTVPVAQSDTNYTLYCEITNLGIPSIADGDTFLLGYYTDGVFGTGNVPTQGWILLLTKPAGQLNLTWANVDGCAQGSGVPIADWGINETIQILFEIVVNLPNMLVSNSTGPTQSTPLTVLPTGMNTYGHLVDASAIQVPTAYVATKYVMRLEDTGLTLAEAAAEARKPL